MTRGIIALVFRCKITGGNLATDDETAAFRWATEHDIRELATEAYAIRVLDASDPDNITLELRPDNASEFMQWFQFRVTDVDGEDLTFNFVNNNPLFLEGGQKQGGELPAERWHRCDSARGQIIKQFGLRRGRRFLRRLDSLQSFLPQFR